MESINRILWVLLGFGVMWPTHSHAEPVNQPTELSARVGGFFGSTYAITIERDELWCSEMRGSQPFKKHLAHPSREQWSRFRAMLDALNAGSWQKSYLNPGVMDGTQWSVRIRYPDLVIDSAGSNSYPNAKGRPNGSPEETSTFQRFRAGFLILDEECKL